MRARPYQKIPDFDRLLAVDLVPPYGDLFQDSRTGKNGWHGMTGLCRQSVFGCLGGYEDVRNADRRDAILPCVGLSAAKRSKDRPLLPAISGSRLILR